MKVDKAAVDPSSSEQGNGDFQFDFDKPGNESDLYSDLDKPREGYENVENDSEGDWDDIDDGEEPPRISETSQEDEEYFKLAMGILDNTRAMAFSMYATGDIAKVADYTVYKDWNDPQHQALLQSGRIVAKKYKLHAFDMLPELMIAGALIMSTFLLYRQAKKDKQETAQKKYEANKAKNGTPIVPMKKMA